MALIDDLVAEMRQVFVAHPDHVRVFTQQEHSFEGWFCGEFVKLLSDLQASGKISGFQNPGRAGTKLIDFVVERTPKKIAIEMKAMPCWTGGSQPTSYMIRSSDGTTGIGGDVDKLAAWPDPGAYLMAFCYQNPGDKLWLSGLKTYAKWFPNNPATPITQPSQFPPEYFVGVLKLK